LEMGVSLFAQASLDHDPPTLPFPLEVLTSGWHGCIPLLVEMESC
jgi:hypothetical protein